MNNVKPGWQTTEFWISFFSILFSFLNQVGWLGWEMPLKTIFMILMAAAAYSLSRGHVKATAIKASGEKDGTTDTV